MKLNNPLLVRWEYASEARLAKRNSIFRALIDGANPEDVAFDAVAEARPERLLDVGCGPGDLTQRFTDELGARVCAVDTSERMIELARARGLDAQVADAEQLPFAPDDFDCVFAGWVLYHVPGLEQAIAECARVLRPSGRFVASSYRQDNFSELWALIDDGKGPRETLSFSSENGAELLGERFAHVERRDVEATLLFPTTESMREFVASTIDRAHLAPRVPELTEPFRATTRHAVFVAERPR
jgi:ubiquinone/menaquinone biosynthesis C-methylase UbiE